MFRSFRLLLKSVKDASKYFCLTLKRIFEPLKRFPEVFEMFVGTKGPRDLFKALKVVFYYNFSVETKAVLGWHVF